MSGPVSLLSLSLHADAAAAAVDRARSEVAAAVATAGHRFCITAEEFLSLHMLVRTLFACPLASLLSGSDVVKG